MHCLGALHIHIIEKKTLEGGPYILILKKKVLQTKFELNFNNKMHLK